MKYLIVLSIIFINFAKAEIQIIASPACQTEEDSKEDIKKLFMLKQTSINGESIRIIDRLEKITYEKFIHEYMNKSLRRMKTYWVRMLFTGKKTPPKKFTLPEINTLVDDRSNCYLSYIEENESKDREWKILNIK